MLTATVVVTDGLAADNGAGPAEVIDDELVARLAGQARAQGLSAVGEGGLLQQLTKRVLEAALDGEMDAHLGYGRHERDGGAGGNARNGRRPKTVLTNGGPEVSPCEPRCHGRRRPNNAPVAWFIRFWWCPMSPIRVASNVSTATVAIIAAWSSWSHMVHVALRFGERPEVAFVLPLSVDGMLIVASTAMVEDKRHGRSVRWSARLAFTAGVAASVAANIAAAHPAIGARVVAGWPAIALLLVVEMLTRTPRTDRTTPAQRVPLPTAETNGRPSTSPAGTTASKASGRRSDEPVAAAVSRMRAEQPKASMGDIAAAIGVSERHVRRIVSMGTPVERHEGNDSVPR